MEIIGIIGEFDPFHRGHAHLIARAKEAFPGSPVVCAMSGPFTRAERALSCGADLILELPVQWAASSAERFARGSVTLLAAAGATHLAFGSEAGELTALEQVAEALDSPAFSQVLQPYLKEGLPFATARQRALEERIGPAAAALRAPNNLLGVEYLRAIHSLAPGMKAVTFPRVGAAHHSARESDGFRSASALRQELLSGGLEEACAGMPEPAAEVLRREWAQNRCPAALEHNTRGIFTRLRTMDADDFAALPDCGEGICRHPRLYRGAGAPAGPGGPGERHVDRVL